MSPSTMRVITRPRFVAPLLAIATLAAAAAAQNCDRTSIGVRPLDDLRDGSYLGFEGGLYPGGVNRCPPEHQAAGEAIAARIVPRDAAGLPAADGRVVVASLGFSLASMPFLRLIGLAEHDPRVAPSVTLANCAFPGQAVTDLADPGSDYWATIVPTRLADAGVTAAQVQVAWLLVGDRTQVLPFPGHVDDLEAKFVAITRNARAAFPRLRLCFVSSLPWLGYSVAPEGGEPYYFEQGFAQKRLIERQIAGDPELSFEGDDAPAPWLAWGPYFWCDGVEPRSDGWQWSCADVLPDGAHPSIAGRQRQAARLLHFLASEPACTPWFRVDGAGPAGHPADVELVGAGTTGTGGEPLLSASALPTVPYRGDFAITARRSLPRGTGVLLLGDSLLPDGGLPFAGGRLLVAIDSLVPVAFDDEGSAATSFGSIPNDPALRDARFYAQLVAFDPGGADGRFALSAALELLLGD